MPARTREQRLALKDKVTLERMRLNQRVGPQARMQQANQPDQSSGLISCVENSAGYLSNADRFHSDTAGEERAKRQNEIERRKKVDEFKRQQTFKREEDRYQQAIAVKVKEEERWNKLREDGGKAKRNQSGAAYDVVSLQYHQTPDGEKQKYHDDMIRYRAQLRAKALVENGDSRASYNIISGGPRNDIQLVNKIEKPVSLLDNTRSPRVDYRRSPR
eukprot:gene19944-25910_t